MQLGVVDSADRLERSDRLTVSKQSHLANVTTWKPNLWLDLMVAAQIYLCKLHIHVQLS